MKSFIKYVFATGVGVMLGLFMVGLLFVALISAIVAFSNSESSPVALDKGYLLIELNRTVEEKAGKLNFEMDGLFEKYQTLGLYEIKAALKKAATDEKIKGVYLRLRSPRCGISTLVAIRKSLEEFKKISKKPIYAYSDLMSERAYYLATVADQINMHSIGDFEFNGLAATPSYFKGLLDKLEITPIIFRAGKYKSPVEPLILKKMSAYNRVQLTRFVGEVWGEIIDKVATSRKISKQKLMKLADNLSVMTPHEALKEKLIDRLVVESDLIDEMRKKAKIDKDEKLFIHLSHYARAASKEGLDTGSDNKIGVIIADGVIVTGRGGKGKIGSDNFVKEVRKLRDDEEIKGVVLRINSPGGSAYASDVIWSELRLLAKKKPLYASLSNIAASGGYYIATAASKIYSGPLTLTGSIGVFGVMMNTQKFFNNKVGMTFDRVVTNPHADLGNASRPMSLMEKQAIQGQVTDIYLRFLEVVKIGRKFKRNSDVDIVAQGRIWSGADGKRERLVDEIGDLGMTIKALALQLKLKEYDVDLYPQKDGFREVFEQFSSSSSLANVILSYLGIQDVPLESGVYALNLFNFKVD